MTFESKGGWGASYEMTPVTVSTSISLLVGDGSRSPPPAPQGPLRLVSTPDEDIISRPMRDLLSTS